MARILLIRVRIYKWKDRSERRIILRTIIRR